MRVLAVHPGPLMYTKIFLRLEPLGLELVAETARRTGHEVRLLDLQVESHRDYFRVLDDWQPEVIAFSCNYLANIPEIIDLAKASRQKLPDVFFFIGATALRSPHRRSSNTEREPLTASCSGREKQVCPPCSKQSNTIAGRWANSPAWSR